MPDELPTTAEPLPGEGFERAKARIGLIAAPTIGFVLALTTDSVSPAMVALLVTCVGWWLSEALPAAVVALLAAVGAVLLGLASPKEAFGAFGKPALFLFVGSFFIAEAMRLHGLGERLARRMVGAARTRLGLTVVVSGTAWALSLVMSNAASTAIVLPIALAIAAGERAHAAGRAGSLFSAGLVLAVAWGASIGGLGTPVGTPPNLIGLAELEQRGLSLGFAEWMAIGIPMGLVMMGGLFVVLRLVFGIGRTPLAPRETAVAPGPWAPGEWSVVGVIGFAIIGWITPSMMQIIAPNAHATAWLDAHVTEEVVALIAGCALFILPGGPRTSPRARPALTWPEATRIEWGVILLFGGGILLGDLAKSSGLAAQWGDSLTSLTGASSTWAIAALCTAAAILLSEAASNTAAATLICPLAGALAEATGAAHIPAVLGATLGASFGFMMPISTAPNALAYATGQVTVGQMIRAGILFDVIGFGLILLALRVFCPLMGWA